MFKKKQTLTLNGDENRKKFLQANFDHQILTYLRFFFDILEIHVKKESCENIDLNLLKNALTVKRANYTAPTL